MRIFQAASAGEDDKVALAKNPLGYKDSNGRTPLHFAAHHGHASTCKLLVQMSSSEKGAADARDADGATAAVLAAAKGHTEVLRVLARAGAKIDIAKANGVGAMHLAASGGYASTVSWLVDHLPFASVDAICSLGTPLHFSAGAGHADVCAILIKANCSLSASSDDGATPLLAAAAGNHGDIFRMMLDAEMKRGADADLAGLLLKRSNDGTTVLEAAAAGGCLAIIQAVIDVVPAPVVAQCVNSENADGVSPVEVAGMHGQVRAVDLLLPLTESPRLLGEDGERISSTALLEKCMNLARTKQAARSAEKDQSIGVMSAFKEEGNEAFKDRDYSRAKSLYNDGVAEYDRAVSASTFLSADAHTEDAAELQVRELVSQLCSNASACCLMGERPERLNTRMLLRSQRGLASCGHLGRKPTTVLVSATASWKCTRTLLNHFGNRAAWSVSRRQILVARRRNESFRQSISYFRSMQLWERSRQRSAAALPSVTTVLTTTMTMTFLLLWRFLLTRQARHIRRSQSTSTGAMPLQTSLADSSRKTDSIRRYCSESLTTCTPSSHRHRNKFIKIILSEIFIYHNNIISFSKNVQPFRLHSDTLI